MKESERIEKNIINYCNEIKILRFSGRCNFEKQKIKIWIYIDCMIRFN